ncbi:MAG: Gfo/Idh/MocA family oxidoreductase [Planctomycetes bacterium]|nr:Gfo/Idh/MocA family oxidoreductase [Planctomycetota bacterium]
MTKPLPVALIGQKFMGRAHSNAWGQASRFFELPRPIVMDTVAGRDGAELSAFAARWGWRRATTRWQDIADDPTIELVDIGTPNDVHREQALAMLAAGKSVACEKPLAGTLADARAMRDAAKKAKKAKTFVWFNYRRCPAVAFARQLVREGRLGRLYHVRATYLQSWGGPATPRVWRFEKKRAGSGAHGDLNAHIVDMARFVTGDEITEIHGAVARTFITERVLPAAEGAGIAKGGRGAAKTGKSDVDDAVLFLAGFKGGAVASFEASRLATGWQNKNTLELHGDKGALRFDFEDMNLLWFHDETLGPATAGWRRIMCTSGGNHPYAGNWWPDAHVLGYEHGFVNMAADIVKAMSGVEPEVPLPDFADAYETQRVLEAAMLSAKERRAVKLSEVK